ncbi:hypothetical protein F5884DRAFT_793261 [Xylogone sp. PMI_703]|nr:hypothetical protein F5884DRAFT_793261 [Xylogone sp. PMI_703]
MPIPFMAEIFFKMLEHLPSSLGSLPIFKIIGALAVVALIKFLCMGATNRSERKMHSKVIMITGGTSGIGAVVALDLAQRGAQIILLTRQPPSDMFIVDFIEDLRARSGNQLIYAEQVDLSSLYSIRQFATKWIDNAPPRRLDMIILCAATLTPPGKPRSKTVEGLEEMWMVNYLANFHLLSILSPAIRAQPPGRDVRIIFATCSSYLRSPPIVNGDEAATSTKDWSTSKAYARSKLALMTFGHAFQKHLDSYKRPDEMPMSAKVIFVDPGYSRTPGMRRWLTRGTLWGLAVYLTLWQNIWLLLKSAEGGAQSVLYASMEASLERGSGGRLIKECQEMAIGRPDIRDEAVAKKLWEGSEKLIERVEREEAVRRAMEKKLREAEQQKDTAGGKTAGKAEAEVKADNSKEGKDKPSRRQRKANK